VLTPAVSALLVEWAATVPFRTAARWLDRVTAGVVTVSGPTAWRALQTVAQRATTAEATTHQAWATTGALPAPQGERVVPVRYVEADGIYVKAQREPAHKRGFEVTCASADEGWQQVGHATPGHPRDHYRLRAKQV
jgi:hypothetical protein